MSALSNLYRQHAEAIEAIGEANGIPDGYELEIAKMDSDSRYELQWAKRSVAESAYYRFYFHRLVPIVKMPEPKESNPYSTFDVSEIHNKSVTITPFGLSHRDQLAMNCPFKLINDQVITLNTIADVTREAYIYADMMIAESKKGQHEPT